MSRKKTSRKNPSRKTPKQIFNPTLLWAGLGIVLVVLAGVFLFNPKGAATAEVLPREVSVTEASTLRDEGAFILDVREPEEWNESHISGATLIPLGELASRVDELPKDREIVVVCRSGNRSAQGRDILLSAGFEQVTSMAGGINQWKAAGFETVSGP
ncbi:MAG: rhodanese-like domain-containing protein [Anaerolineales bacterium]|nr:rhodanese-like domain-containing protein [Anaerolineales bacterium]NUQ85113.1 rhodanese-like domain-containing protein [Anaerolineales bacterium]